MKIAGRKRRKDLTLYNRRRCETQQRNFCVIRRFIVGLIGCLASNSRRDKTAISTQIAVSRGGGGGGSSLVGGSFESRLRLAIVDIRGIKRALLSFAQSFPRLTTVTGQTYISGRP